MAAARAPTALGCGIALLVCAWICATPPGAAPDEDAHYVKALGAGGGQFLGSSVSQRPSAGQGSSEEQRGQIAGNWLARNTREFSVPRELLPSFGCFDLFVRPSSATPAACRSTQDGLPGSPLVAARLVPGTGEARERTYVGTYPPFVYVLPGVAMRATNDAYVAFKVGRAVSAALCLALLLAAVALLWEPVSGGIALTGLMVALTPGALFIASSLTPSGPEVAAGACFVASLLRLVRQPRAPGWVWLVCACSGSVLMLSRPLGVLFAPVAVGAVALLAGPSRLARAWRAGGRRSRATAVGLALAGAIGVYWQGAHQPEPDWELAGLIDAIGPSVSNVPTVLREEVGLFAAYFPAPGYVFAPWAVLLACMLLAALYVADADRRLRLLAVCVGTLVLTVLLSVLHRRTGFDQFSGRYILPVFVVVPLGAAEVLREYRHRLPPGTLRAVVAIVAVSTGFLQAVAWWAAARRSAVGTDGPLFFTSADFRPPGGWILWALFVVLAVLSYVAAGVSAAASRRRR